MMMMTTTMTMMMTNRLGGISSFNNLFKIHEFHIRSIFSCLIDLLPRDLMKA